MFALCIGQMYGQGFDTIHTISPNYYYDSNWYTFCPYYTREEPDEEYGDPVEIRMFVSDPLYIWTWGVVSPPLHDSEVPHKISIADQRSFLHVVGLPWLRQS